MHPQQYHDQYRGGVAGMTASPFDAPLSALRDHVENLAVAMVIWEHRHEPDAQARRAASGAIDAIDGALRELHQIRSRLTGEIRAADDAAAQRADALLRHRPPHDLR